MSKQTYRLTAAGKRQAGVLLVAALLVWAFAIWSFASTLRLSYNPVQFWPSLQESLAAGLGLGQVVPALLMLVLMIATPLLIWALLQELSAAYTPLDEGLRFEALGLSILIPWPAVNGLRRAHAGDEAFDELIVDDAQGAPTAHPVVRLLHRQAVNPGHLPIYPGVEQREELIAEIQRHLAASPPTSGAAPTSA